MHPHQNNTICSSLTRFAGSAALVIGASLISAPAHSDVVLLGSDYLMTTQPTWFLVPANTFHGVPVGPGLTDTIVQRQGNCGLGAGGLTTAGALCTIPIEMIALSLQSDADPLVRIRESPTLVTAGLMTIISNGSGTGGTFDSFFDIFFELSLDGGATWLPQPGATLTSTPGTPWTTIPHDLLVPGLVGDQAANLHTNKGDCANLIGDPICVDFYLVGPGQGGQGVSESEPVVPAFHSAIPTPGPNVVPEPGSLALLAAGLALLGFGKRRNRV